jgi:cystathionine beta-lyase
VLAKWLQGRPEVERVLHPALPDHPSHNLWKRDFLGSSGLFGVVLKPAADERVNAMIDGMELFGLGFSWGGYESLIVPSALTTARTATKWDAAGPTIRLHAGLEDPQDLIEDLASGFDRLRGN